MRTEPRLAPIQATDATQTILISVNVKSGTKKQVPAQIKRAKKRRRQISTVKLPRVKREHILRTIIFTARK